MRWMEQTGASISRGALKHSCAPGTLLCPVSLWGAEQGQLHRCHGSPGSTAHTVPWPLPLGSPVGDPRASSAGLGCTWLLPKASQATYFRQQYKNTGAGPKGG